jgi:hypothetical protein
MIRKWLAIGIILLFAGTGIISASYTNTFSSLAHYPQESLVHNSNQRQEDVICDRGYFYGCCVYDPSGTHPLGLITFNTPDAVDSLPGPFIICGDIDENGNWYGIDSDGGIWLIVLYDSEMVAQTIPFHGLAFNNQGQIWYGCTGSSLYIVDINTGATSYIGDFGTDYSMADLTCGYNDLNLYGIGSNGTTSVLFSIDVATGEATEIGPTGLWFAMDAGYDRDNDYPYITGYNQQGMSGLFSCDILTGTTTLIGHFEGNMEVEALVIPYTPPIHYLFARFTWSPLHPSPGETILFNASESFGSNPIILYEWDWDTDGNYDDTFTVSTVTHIWTSSGSYTVTLRITDDIGLTATKSHNVVVNQPPDIPIINGPANGHPGNVYTFTIVSSDPDQNSIYYWLGWGDGDITGWLGPYASGQIITLSHVWNNPGTYTILAIAKDIYDTESSWGTSLIIMTNDPPETPQITGLENGTMNYTYVFSIGPITDPDGDVLYSKWDWGDGNITDWLGPYPSGQIISTSHIWTNPGIYWIRAKLRDTYDAESNWSEPHIMTINENQPPNDPTITGPEKGKPGNSYKYTITGIDPEEDVVSAYIMWGDDTITDWTTFHNSGETFSVTHSWAKKGTYSVQVKVKDTHGAESGWTTLSVTMPFSYDIPFQTFLERFLERFPRAFPLLRHLMGY